MIYVSDHALVRYLERVKGLDLEPVRAELARVVEPAVAAGAKSLKREGFEYILDGHKLITVQKRTRRTKK